VPSYNVTMLTERRCYKMSVIIKTTNLTKIYGNQTSVDHLNMNVNQGEIYGFLGRNGAGKTTTIRMLLGLIKPTNGKIEIFGENLFKNQKEILRRIGSMVEVPGFYENLTAKENLLINAKIMGIYKKNAIEEALEIVGLHNETKKLVGKYSLGMKQRLGIARALVHYPEVLILDEPTNINISMVYKKNVFNSKSSVFVPVHVLIILGPVMQTIVEYKVQTSIILHVTPFHLYITTLILSLIFTGLIYKFRGELFRALPVLIPNK
jgi:ABC-type Na+ transport system ATPase subunit NatA